MRVMVVPVLATTALACTVIAAGQARPASLPVVYDCADVAVTQPASLIHTCADLGDIAAQQTDDVALRDLRAVDV